MAVQLQYNDLLVAAKNYTKATLPISACIFYGVEEIQFIP